MHPSFLAQPIPPTPRPETGIRYAAVVGEYIWRVTVTLTFLFTAPGLAEGAFQPARWSLPGLTVEVSGAPAGFSVERRPACVEVVYDPGVGQPIELSLSET